jgi:hypothetical protein
MNLVDAIKNQLSDGVVRQLNTLLGAGESTTRTAVEAAVPALLSGLSSVAASPGGAQKLISALGRFEGGSHGNVGQNLSDHPNSVLEQGSNLLNSLMGGNMLGGITDALARFSGLSAGMVQRLLGYLMPLVLGSVAGRFAGKSLNPQSLANMLGDQKANIASALPSGLSLANVPGLGKLGSAVQAGTEAVQNAGSSALGWVLPIGGLAILGLVLWALFRPSATPSLAVPNAQVPDVALNVGVPDVTKISTGISGTINALNQSLAGIQDATSAAEAMPKLRELAGKLGDMKNMANKLPEAGKAKIHDMVKNNLGKLDDQFAKLAWAPGVEDKIKPAVDDIMDRYASLGGVPVPRASTVSAKLANEFSSLTGTLASIKDAASAEAALPKLKDLNEKLDTSAKMMAELPDAAKSTISSLLKSALTTLQGVANKVLANTAASEKVKPVVDTLMDKLTAMAK